jgi:hypothetical protein
MAKHALTLEERIRGVRAAITSPRTPNHLRPGLRKHLDLLTKKFDLSKQRKPRKKNRSNSPEKPFGLPGWLRL